MGRLVEPPPSSLRPRAASAAPADPYVERVAKYVPVEIVAGYLPLVSMLRAIDPKDETRVFLAWVLFAIGVILTPVYLAKVGKPRRDQRQHLFISTIAFILWAYALGGPAMDTTPYYRPHIGAFAAGIFTWIAGLFPIRN